jgi:type IV secretory pathway VirB2 component (pilin)
MLGLGALFGKVSWGMASMVGVGIAALANCYTIAQFLVPSIMSVQSCLTVPPYFPDTGSPMGDVLCTVLGWLVNGSLPRGLITCAVIMLGIGATLGKVSWGMAVTIAVGIAVLTGAVALAGAFGIPDYCGL